MPGHFSFVSLRIPVVFCRTGVRYFWFPAVPFSGTTYFFLAILGCRVPFFRNSPSFYRIFGPFWNVIRTRIPTVCKNAWAGVLKSDMQFCRGRFRFMAGRAEKRPFGQRILPTRAPVFPRWRFSGNRRPGDNRRTFWRLANLFREWLSPFWPRLNHWFPPPADALRYMTPVPHRSHSLVMAITNAGPGRIS